VGKRVGGRGTGDGVKEGKDVGERTAANVIVAAGAAAVAVALIGVSVGALVAASGVGVFKPGVAEAVAAGELQALRERSRIKK
jgi:hypothetical protein